MMNDPIGDMIIRVKIAYHAGLLTCSVPYSKMKWEIAEILMRENCVAEISASKENKSIELTLRYEKGGEPAVKQTIRVSKPGRRIYEPFTNLPHMKNNFGFAIISTSRGLMTAFEARQKKMGGEVICKVLRV
jgi:small subunit ribosomal protein S8